MKQKTWSDDPNHSKSWCHFECEYLSFQKHTHILSLRKKAIWLWRRVSVIFETVYVVSWWLLWPEDGLWCYTNVMITRQRIERHKTHFFFTLNNRWVKITMLLLLSKRRADKTDDHLCKRAVALPFLMLSMGKSWGKLIQTHNLCFTSSIIEVIMEWRRRASQSRDWTGRISFWPFLIPMLFPHQNDLTLFVSYSIPVVIILDH